LSLGSPLGSGIARGAGTIGHEAAQARAAAGDWGVEAFEEARWDALEEACCRSRDLERAEELHDTCAVADEVSVGQRQAPARVPLLLGERREQPRGPFVSEAEERKLVVTIDPGDDTRRAAAEASVVVVEKDRAGWLLCQARYAAEGLPAGVKRPRTSSVPEPVFSTMWT
jgi:hypothetical protein